MVSPGRGDRVIRGEIAVLAVIVLVGAALRSYRLGFQSLWFDELFSAVFSGPGRSLVDIVEKYTTDVHPLGYPVLLHVWLLLFGDSELALRSLSVVAGGVGIAVIGLVGRRIGISFRPPGRYLAHYT